MRNRHSPTLAALIAWLSLQQGQILATAAHPSRADSRPTPFNILDHDSIVGHGIANVASASSETDPTPFSAVVKWHWLPVPGDPFPDAANVMMTPSVFDLNRDGTPDVIFGSSAETSGPSLVRGVLRVVDGANGRLLFTVSDPSLQINAASAVAVADLDRDGFAEIIACEVTGSRLLAFNHDGSLRWRSSPIEAVNWGAPSIADLDRDGQPEIVIGRQVLDKDGQLLWTGTADRGDPDGAGALSIVADVDLDGQNEVVAGTSLYDAAGHLKASLNDSIDGFTAVGNFDADPEAEIVVVALGTVRLLNHDLTTVWGPVAIPGGGVGGPPTVADFDGDGKAEVGVAGATRYVVYETDGTVRWTRNIQDGSSNRTGSSVFDFEGDGAAEVLYGDELTFWVLRGDDGAVLAQSPKSSCTWFEYPVVADLDADGHADVLAAANSNCGFGPQQGLYAYVASGNNWAATRRLWNQHSYHVTNVNEDASIPLQEEPNWLAPGLNNFRLNTFGPKDVTDPRPDLTATDARVYSLPGTGARLSARISNTGSPEHVSLFDLLQDFSLERNPNGPWAYNEGGRSLPLVAAFESALGTFLPPPKAWARSENGHDRVPVWMRPAALQSVSPGGGDFSPGDVLVRTQDEVNGVGNGEANVTWTSPRAGRISIAGSVWLARNAGQSVRWNLYVRDRRVSSGDLFDGDPWNRARPFELSSGSGGVAAIAAMPVLAGDVVRLEFVRSSSLGEFVGVNLRIRLAEDAVGVRTRVAFYRGDPSAGGTLLGTTPTSRTLGHNEFEDVSLNWLSASPGLQRIVVVADDDGTGLGQVDESDEGNNKTGTAALVGVSALTLVDDPVARFKDRTVDLRWSPIPGAASYNVYRRSGSSAPLLIRAGLVSNVASLSDVGLSNGTTYYYTVRWVSPLGVESGAGTEISATPTAALARGLMPPTMLSAPVTRAAVGNGYQYQARASDPDAGDVLTYSIVNSPAGVAIEPATGFLRWLPVESQAGYQTITIKVADRSGRFAQQSFHVFVSLPSQNHAPNITSIPVTTATVGQAYAYQVTASDADAGDLLTYEVTSAPEGVGINSATGAVVWTPRPEQTGAQVIVIRVHDLANAFATQTVTVAVKRANHAPDVTAGPDRETSLSYVGGPPTGLNAPFALTTLSTGFNGPIGIDYHAPSHRVVLSVNYGNGGNPYNFELVNASGTRAQFSAVAGLSDEIKIATARDEGGGRSRGGFFAGELFVGTGSPGVIARVSADGTSIQNPWVALPSETGLMRGSLYVDRTGVFGGDLIAVTTTGGVWRVSSSGAMTRLASLGTHLEGLVTVPADVGRYGPWAGRILIGAENQGLFYSVDPLGQVSSFALGINPEDIEVIPANENFFGVDFGASRLVGAPATLFASMVGDLLVSQEVGGQLFRVRWTGSAFEKTQLASVSQWEHMTFAPAGITPIPPLSATITLNGYVTDDGEPQGGQLRARWTSVSGPALPALSTPDSPTTDVTFSEAGNYVFRLTADDGAITASDEVVVRVDGVNRPPIITSLPATTGLTTRAYSYNVTAIDPDPNDTVRFALRTAPVGMVIDPDSGLVLWTPLQSQAGTWTVSVIARDREGLEAEQSFNLQVTLLPPNRPPVFTTLAPPAGEVATPYVYDASATDPDLGDLLTYSLANAPAGMNIEPLTGRIGWTPTLGQVGPQSASVVVTDLGGLFATQTILVTVTVPDTTPPSVTIVTPTTGSLLTTDAPIIGSVADEHLRSWVLEYRVSGTSTWNPLGQGTAPVAGGLLGTFPTTLVANNPYRLRLTAFDERQSNSQEIEVQVNSGELKLGDFTLGFEDLRIPGFTFPISVQRKYDSKRPASGDFGPGWTLGFNEVSVQLDVNNDVFLTLPDGRRVAFQFTPQQIGFGVVNTAFTAQPGVYDSLQNLDCPQVFGSPGNWLCAGFQPWQPRNWKLKTKAGVTYLINDNRTVTRMEDRVGNWIAIAPTGITSNFGRDVAIERDGASRITRIIGPPTGTTPGGALRYEYDAQGRLATFVDQNGSATTFSYEHPTFSHYLTKITDPLGRDLVRNVFNAEGRLVAQCDPNGNILTLVGCAQFDPQPGTNTFTALNARGFRTDLVTDDRGNVASERRYLDAATYLETARTYDANNNTLTERDPEGNLRSYTYDARGNRLSETDPGGRTTFYTYAAGCDTVATSTDPAGHVTTNTYDAQCNLRFVEDALHAKTEYRYNSAGQRTQMIDANGTTWTWSYLPNALLQSVVDPFGKATTFGFDNAGNLLSRTDRMGRRIDFQYDAANHVTRETWDTGRVTTYLYDTGGALVSAVDPDSSLTMTYDNLARLLSVDNVGTPGVPRVVMNYRYDANGNTTRVQDSLGGSTDYSYDGLDRLSRVTQSGTGVQPKRVDLSYSEASLLTQLRRYSDLGGTLGVANTTYEYECGGCQGRLTAIRHRKAADNSVINDMTLGHDALGNTTSSSDVGGVHSYTYDVVRRLTSATHQAGGPLPNEFYTYDAVSNRLSSHLSASYVYSWQVEGAGDRLLQDDQFDYAYDDEGQLERKTTRATGAYREFTYDHLGRLTSSTSRGSDGTVIDAEKTVYDVVDRKIVVNSRGVSTSSVFDGRNVHVAASLSGVSRRLNGRIFGSLLAQDSAGATEWLLADSKGTVNSTVLGGVVTHYAVDSFGNAGTGSWPVSTFAGGSRTPSGLVDFQARHYDSTIGRFLSEDALAPFDYVYARSSPLDFIDPTGDTPISENLTLVVKGVSSAAIGVACGHQARRAGFTEGASVGACAVVSTIGVQVAALYLVDAAITQGINVAFGSAFTGVAYQQAFPSYVLSTYGPDVRAYVEDRVRSLIKR